MTLTSVLPTELIALVIEFYSRDDSDSVLLRQVSKTLMDMSPRPKNRKRYRLDLRRFYCTIPLMRWAKENRCPLYRLACYAIRTGNREILSMIRQTGYQFSKSLFYEAIERGDLEFVKWFRANGCPRGKDCYDVAIRGGYFEILKWLRIVDDNPWSVLTCGVAAMQGRLDILKWMRENGCPWDVFTTRLAADYDNIRTLRWAIKNGCPLDTTYCLGQAVYYHRHRIVRLLRRLIEERNSSTR